MGKGDMSNYCVDIRVCVFVHGCMHVVAVCAYMYVYMCMFMLKNCIYDHIIIVFGHVWLERFVLLY